MKELIALYVLRHGPTQALIEIGQGFRDAGTQHSTWADEGKAIMLSAGSEVTGLAHLTSEAERNADHTLIRRRQFAEPNPSGGSLSDEDLAKLCTLTGATA